MSTEILNRTSDYIEENTPDISNKKESRKKVNIEVLKKRVFEEKRREKFQNRVLIGMFCFSIAILGYIIV
tara:strand:- start:2205 stop:2414 length:210 start_codon:yes stop_codon:yes gene_type:complete